MEAATRKKKQVREEEEVEEEEEEDMANLKHKKQKVCEKEETITPEERERKLRHHLNKIQKLIFQLKSLEDDFSDYHASKTEPKCLWAKEVHEALKHDRMVLGAGSTWSLDNLVKKITKKVKRLTCVEEEVMVLSEGIDRDYLKRVYEQVSKDFEMKLIGDQKKKPLNGEGIIWLL